MGYTYRSVKDINDMLRKESREIVKKIEESEERCFKVFLIDLSSIDDFKPFLQRILMLINDLSPSDSVYDFKDNSIDIYYDY